MKVYIQRIKDVYLFDGCYAAHEGALYKGYDVIFFEEIQEVPASRDILLIACVEDTEVFFKRLDIDVPNSIEIFSYLKEHELVKRRIFFGDLESFISRPYNKPKFIKPRYKVKGFPSGVIKNAASETNKKLLLGEFDPEMEVMISEVVDFRSEYRVYVNGRKGILGMKHYQGNPLIFPNIEFIYNAINVCNKFTDFPITFTIDVGILPDGSCEVVEIQDAWSIGAYGLDGEIYIDFLLARWKQLMRQQLPLNQE